MNYGLHRLSCADAYCSYCDGGGGGGDYGDGYCCCFGDDDGGCFECYDDCYVSHDGLIIGGCLWRYYCYLHETLSGGDDDGLLI